jgi:restriction system protein
VARRSSVWDEISRDREKRRRHNEQVARLQRQVERELAADQAKARALSDREAKAREKEQAEREHRAALAQADEQNERLAQRVDELTRMLRTCVAHPPLQLNELRVVEPTPFDPGTDGASIPPPRRPVIVEGGLLSLRRRRREFDEMMARYEREAATWTHADQTRQRRLAERRAEHDRAHAEAQAAATQQADSLESGIAAGDTTAIEHFARAAIERLPLPDGVDLQPLVAYRHEPRELVLDIRLPTAAVVPEEKSVKYVRAQRSFTAKDRARTEINTLYRGVLAQLPLCVLNALFGAFDPDIVDSITVNGVLPAVDRATGRSQERTLVSVTTSRATFGSLVLDAMELDPVLCVRQLGAKLSPHPLDYEEVPAFLTFEMAKYQLGTSVEVAAGLDGRTNLIEMDPFAFEQLVRELLRAMTGNDARVTRRSKDDGIDGVLFDCSATLGGEFVVQAKRYRNVVPANDVRALAGVMHDKRANHALFVTTSWFSDDGRRFASDNRVRLIEGPELKHLLRDHLDLDVLIPPTRRRRAAS